ncbi:hypothetical protein AAVH_30804 [Aphelenchoides avenae]|nr:hypothetical protein AAVH_30804 [Aphelenchus avenae]
MMGKRRASKDRTVRRKKKHSTEVRRKVLPLELLVEIMRWLDRRSLDQCETVNRQYGTALKLTTSILRPIIEPFGHRRHSGNLGECIAFFVNGLRRSFILDGIFFKGVLLAPLIHRLRKISHSYDMTRARLVIDDSHDVRVQDSMAVLDLLSSFPIFHRIWASATLFKSVGIDDALIRFFAQRGIWEQRTDSGRSPLWWPCSGGVTEDAILDYCFGHYECSTSVRRLYVKQAKVTTHFVTKLLEARRTSSSTDVVELGLTDSAYLDDLQDSLQKSGGHLAVDENGKDRLAVTFDDIPNMRILYSPPPYASLWCFSHM